MANLMKELKNEISRLAKKEAKQIEVALKKEIAILRKRLSATQKRLAEVELVKKVVDKLPAATAPVVENSEETALRKMRVTGTMIKKMREKKKLSQTQLAKAMGVSLQSVYQWERKAAASLKKMRMTVRKALADVRGKSPRQILKEIEAAKLAKPAKAKPVKKTAKKPVKKTTKKTTKKAAPKKAAPKKAAPKKAAPKKAVKKAPKKAPKKKVAKKKAKKAAKKK
jgi:adenylate kinase